MGLVKSHQGGCNAPGSVSEAERVHMLVGDHTLRPGAGISRSRIWSSLLYETSLYNSNNRNSGFWLALSAQPVTIQSLKLFGRDTNLFSHAPSRSHIIQDINGSKAMHQLRCALILVCSASNSTLVIFPHAYDTRERKYVSGNIY